MMSQVSTRKRSDQSSKCGLCDKMFGDRSKLMEHMETHNKAKSLPCAICKKNFKCVADLDKHYLLHKMLMQPYGCPACDSRFGTQQQLMAHVDGDHPELTIDSKSSPRSSPRKSPVGKSQIRIVDVKSVAPTAIVDKNSPNENFVFERAATRAITKKSILKKAPTPAGKKRPLVWKVPVVSPEKKTRGSLGNQLLSPKRKIQFDSPPSPKKMKVATPVTVVGKNIASTASAVENRNDTPARKTPVTKTRLMQSISEICDKTELEKPKSLVQTRLDLLGGGLKASFVNKGPIRVSKVAKPFIVYSPSKASPSDKADNTSILFKHDATPKVEPGVFVQSRVKETSGTTPDFDAVRLLSPAKATPRVIKISDQNSLRQQVSAILNSPRNKVSKPNQIILPSSIKLIPIPSTSVLTPQKTVLKNVSPTVIDISGDSKSTMPRQIVKVCDPKNVSPKVIVQSNELKNSTPQSAILNSPQLIVQRGGLKEEAPTQIVRVGNLKIISSGQFVQKSNLNPSKVPKVAEIKVIQVSPESPKLIQVSPKRSTSQVNPKLDVTPPSPIKSTVLPSTQTIVTPTSRTRLTRRRQHTIAPKVTNVANRPKRVAESISEKEIPPIVDYSKVKIVLPTIRLKRVSDREIEKYQNGESDSLKSNMGRQARNLRKNVGTLKLGRGRPGKNIVNNIQGTSKLQEKDGGKPSRPGTRLRRKAVVTQPRTGNSPQINDIEKSSKPFKGGPKKAAVALPQSESSPQEKDVEKPSKPGRGRPKKSNGHKDKCVPLKKGLGSESMLGTAQKVDIANSKSPALQTSNTASETTPVLRRTQRIRRPKRLDSPPDEEKVTRQKKEVPKLATARNGVLVKAKAKAMPRKERKIADVINAESSNKTMSPLSSPDPQKTPRKESKIADVINAESSSKTMSPQSSPDPQKTSRKESKIANFINAESSSKTMSPQSSPAPQKTPLSSNIRVVTLTPEIMRRLKAAVLKNSPSSTPNHISLVIPTEVFSKIQEKATKNKITEQASPPKPPEVIGSKSGDSATIPAEISVEEIKKEEQRRKEMEKKKALYQELMEEVNEKAREKRLEVYAMRVVKFFNKHKEGHLENLMERLLGVTNLSVEKGAQLLKHVKSLGCLECTDVVGRGLCSLGFGDEKDLFEKDEDLSEEENKDDALQSFIRLSTPKAKRKQLVKKANISLIGQKRRPIPKKQVIVIKSPVIPKKPVAVLPKKKATSVFNPIKSSLNKGSVSYLNVSVNRPQQKVTPTKICRIDTTRTCKGKPKGIPPITNDPFADISIITEEKFVLECHCQKSNCNGLHPENFLI